MEIKYRQLKRTAKELGIFFVSKDTIERFKDDDTIFFDKTTRIESGSAILAGSYLPKIGLGSYSWSPLSPLLEIGRYCSIAGGLKIIGGRHPIESLTTSSIQYDKHFSIVNFLQKEYDFSFKPVENPQKSPTIKIEHDVWIGGDVTLNRGIVIGTGAVIAAGSLVTKDVRPYTIVGGNPARVIRNRFSEELSIRLLESEWWSFSPDKIMIHDTSDPEKFLRTFKKPSTKFDPQAITYDTLKKIPDVNL